MQVSQFSATADHYTWAVGASVDHSAIVTFPSCKEHAVSLSSANGRKMILKVAENHFFFSIHEFVFKQRFITVSLNYLLHVT
jgi:hypothetical protein